MPVHDGEVIRFLHVNCGDLIKMSGHQSKTVENLSYLNEYFDVLHVSKMYASKMLYPDSKVHGANMRPIWGRQDPGGPHVGPMKLAIWDSYTDS